MKFKEKYLPFFHVVCVFMGGDWRVNKIKSHDHRIFLMSPSNKEYSLSVGLEKGKFSVLGHAESNLHRSTFNSCKLTTTRSAEVIAAEIHKRILFDMSDRVAEVRRCQEKHAQKIEEKSIIKNILTRFFNLSGYYMKWQGFKCKSNGVSGYVDHHNINEYSLKIDRLTSDQLVRISAFINSL